ncbi:UNVERIFIED_CONTAM: hypothetical protein GTU68_028335 [Idotea baltica]|nr:hypothetical protein [Idotea baltica]
MSNILPKREIIFDLDKEDNLPPEGAFALPPAGNGQTYLCSHSLGPLPTNSKNYLERELQRWGDLGVAGYFDGSDGWLHYLDPLNLMMSKIVGAKPHEVVIMNSLTTNLHLMLAGFYRPRGAKNKILMERPAFGSDVYAASSHAKVRGVEEAVLSWDVNRDTGYFESSDLEELLNQRHGDICMILLGGINYLSGELLDMKGITEIAHRYDIPIGFDLAHAVGNVDLKLSDWNVDFAVWCTYKYLCGGPGSVGACYINERFNAQETYFKGWWGNSLDTRFEMSPHFMPSEGAARWQLSNPPLMALPPLKASLELFDQIGFSRISVKTRRLAEYLFGLLRDWKGGAVVTPGAPGRHGAMISIKIENESARMYTNLSEAGFIVDHRSPDIIRVAPHGLLNTFDDCYRFAKKLIELSNTTSTLS